MNTAMFKLISLSPSSSPDDDDNDDDDDDDDLHDPPDLAPRLPLFPSFSGDPGKH